MPTEISLVNNSNPGQTPGRGDSVSIVVTSPPNGKHDIVAAIYSDDWELEYGGGPGYVEQWTKTDDDDPGPEQRFDIASLGSPETGHPEATTQGGAWLGNSQMYVYVLQGTDFRKPPVAMAGFPVNP